VVVLVILAVLGTAEALGRVMGAGEKAGPPKGQVL